MPSDDLILNLKQIEGYPDAAPVMGTDAVLIQRGGLGGPYLSAAVQDLVGGALAAGGDMTIAGQLNAFAIRGGTLGFSNASLGQLAAINASFVTLAINGGTINGDPIVSKSYADGLHAETVTSFNFKRGDVVLDVADIIAAQGAPIASPVFVGNPQAPTPDLASNDSSISTTAFVQQAIAAYINYVLTTQGLVNSFNGRVGAVVLTNADVVAAGAIAAEDAALTGVPTAPTPAPGDNSTAIATTAFVAAAVTNIDLGDYAPINSPAFSGQPTAPTPPAAADDGRIATTAFVHNAVVASTTGVSSFNTRTGAVVLNTADITSAGGAVLASPVFTGVPTAPTATAGTNTAQLATTAFVTAALAGGSVVSSFNTRVGAVILTGADISAAGGALLSSPALTGAPTAPTAAGGTNTTQIATTAFVANTLASLGGVVNSFNGRSGAVTLAANDISAAGGAVLASPSFSGTPTAPTATAGTSTQQLATTAFVMNALATGAGVASFNGRTGAVTLQGGDVSGAGGALVASPTFTGTPAGPTASVGTNTTQLATTAYVMAALTANSVASFNTRTGAVTLTAADITSAGGALLASPAFSGVPTAPTAAQTTNTTQLATTAFVQSVVNAIGAGVVSFNGRTGTVTLQANDISAAGGALLAGPAFTGVPTAPTPATTDNSTALATTAFVRMGVTDGSNATAGQIGEVISSVTSAAVSVPNAAAVNVTSIPLTAGDWDVQGEVLIAIGTAAATLVAAAINSVSATIPAIPTPMGASRAQITASLTATANQSLGLATCRVSVAAAVTMYLIATANYASGSTTAQGKIWARRAR